MTPVRGQTLPLSFRPAYPDKGGSGARTNADLLGTVQACARYAHDHTPNLTQSEKDLLQAQIKGRYAYKTLSDLMELVARTPSGMMLAEAIHGEALRLMPAPETCPVETYLDETRLQAPADVEAARFIAERTPTRRDAAIQAAVQHMDRLRRFVNALHLWPRRA